jgi:hypothetical protein
MTHEVGSKFGICYSALKGNLMIYVAHLAGTVSGQWQLGDHYEWLKRRKQVWLSHCVKIRKVASSISDEVIEFFTWPSLSTRTMALGSTQPLREMSTRNLPAGKVRSACKAKNLTAIYEPIVYKMCKPWCLITLWVSIVCYRDSFPFYYVSENVHLGAREGCGKFFIKSKKTETSSCVSLLYFIQIMEANLCRIFVTGSTN